MKQVTFCGILITLSLLCAITARAEPVSVCYLYGCKRTFSFDFDAAAQAAIRDRLAQSTDPASERENIAWAVQQMLLLAARDYPPLAEDKAGNLNDSTSQGRMDCVDHSTNDSTFLKVFERHGWLRFHRTNGTTWRTRILFDLHYTAVLREIDSGHDWAVDTWFKDFGAPPVVIPLDEWKNGYHPEGW